TIAGALLVAAEALLSTPVMVSGTHLISVIVCAHRSPEPHLPWQGSDSHNPDLGLQNVSPVQIAMHPPAARDAAAAPMARLLIAEKPGTAPIPVAGSLRDYRRHWTPVHLDWPVAELDAAVGRAQAAGATLEGGIREKKWGRLAILADPFGNGFCLLEFRGRGY